MIFKIPSQEVEHKAFVVDKTETGFALTTNIELAAPVQAPVEPSMVYVVVTLGLTTIELLVAPVFQVYELAPLADNVTDFPAHTELELATIEMAKDEAPTDTPRVCDVLHPGSVPINV